MVYADPKDPRALEARRRHYYNNKQAYIARSVAQKKAIRDYVMATKDRPCMDCGVQYPSYVMDLDHRDPDQKEFEPARLCNSGSMKKAILEIAKCDVVCSNCHRERTWGKK